MKWTQISKCVTARLTNSQKALLSPPLKDLPNSSNQAQQFLFPAPQFVAAAYGGGVDSTAMLIQLVNTSQPVDLITFADTGAELPEVYDHIAKFSAWLTLRDYPPVTWVRYQCLGQEDLLEAHMRRGVLPSLAYGRKSCSLAWKVAPQDRLCNHYRPCQEVWAAGSRVTKLIGFNCDETHRYPLGQDAKYSYHYPLRQWQWTRQQCEQLVTNEGFIPQKSACFFCPATKKNELVQLAKKHPALMQKALAFEDRSLPKLKTCKGLGRSYNWRLWLESNGHWPPTRKID